MLTHSGNTYLLEETSEPHTRTPMDPQQFVTIFTDIQDKLDTLTQTSNQTEERLVKLKTAREPPKTEETPLQPNAKRSTQHNAHKHDEQYLRSIKMDVPTVDGCLDPQLFLDWIQLDKYLTWYDHTEPRKVKFAAMKLIGQASQYWTNLEIMRAACGQGLKNRLIYRA